MLETLSHLFSSGSFIPHGHCYLWKPDLVWLHLVSDSLIAISYYSIPITLLYCVRKRQDVPFDWMFQLFGAFIIACGTTHLMEVWTLWHPIYWISGLLKAITAGVSLYTAAALAWIVPSILTLPSPAQLEAVNRSLERKIYERQQIETSLRQSEARYRAVVQDQTELICRFLADGTFTFVNDAYCRYFGQIAADLVGHTFTPVIAEEDLPLVQQQLSTISRTNPVTAITNRVILPNGSVRTQQWINRAIYDQQGQFVEYQAVGRDITEQKQIEIALQESQRFIQKIADTAPVILYVYDFIDQRIVYTNRGVLDLLGYSSEDTPAKTEFPIELLHPDDRFLMLQQRYQRWQSASESDILQSEYRMKHHNGEWRYIQAQETLFARTSEGLPKQILGAAVDITDRKQTQQLQAALKEKEILLKEVHHRVKNNLQIIYSLLRIQSRQVKDPQVAGIFLESQNRIKSIALIHEKLYRSEDFLKIELSQYIPNLVASLFSSYAIHADLVQFKTSVDGVSLDIDTAIPCGLIINELISNALKYAFSKTEAGEIYVEFRKHETGQISLICRDNGIGIPKEFDLHNSRSLGLTLVKDLVEQLEGSMTIDRCSGTTFEITFPEKKA